MVQNVFRSGFLVRATHTVLTWVVTLVLFLHETDLRRCEQRGELLQPALFLLTVVLSVVLYFAASLRDPGFVLADPEPVGPEAPAHPLQPDSEETEAMIPNCRPRRCGHCLLLRPLRARHCRSCGHCVRRFDHHCPWLENCVGEGNHRCFLLYLLVQLGALLWALHQALSAVSPSPSWDRWFQLNGVLLAALVVVGLAAPAVLLLLCCHLYLISINCTTWEFMSRHRISYLKGGDNDDDNPFDRGVLCNLRDFCCACGTVAWERRYRRKPV